LPRFLAHVGEGQTGLLQTALTLPFMALGAHGVISVAYNSGMGEWRALPLTPRTVDLWRSHRRDRGAEARRLVDALEARLRSDLGFDPDGHWHFSVSGMRTGDLKADQWSAMWFGNGFFRSIGPPGTTIFHAEAVEGDLSYRWRSGHVSAFGGWVGYYDNALPVSDARDIYYYSAEVLQDLPRKVYAVTRFSQAFSSGITKSRFGTKRLRMPRFSSTNSRASSPPYEWPTNT